MLKSTLWVTCENTMTRRLSEDDDDDSDGEEKDGEFDGPTMDVILMVQNYDNNHDIAINSIDAADYFQ